MSEPTGLIGGHIIAYIGDYNRDNNQAALTSLGGKFAVFVNDIHAVAMWLASGGVGAHRVLTPHFNDDDADAHFDPVEYADHVCNELDIATAHLPAHLKRNAVAHGGNELFTELPARTDPWLAKFIDRCTARGYLVVVGNWAYKNVPPPLPLTAAALRRNKGWMGFHEGTFADAPLAPDAFADGAIGGFIAWQEKNPGIPVWITEFAGSATAHQGWQTLYNGDAKLWAAQIDWAMRNVYQPRNVPISMFTKAWDKGAGWSWYVPELVTEVNRMNREYVYMSNPTTPPAPPVQPPTEGGVKGVIASLPQGVAYRNIRVQPVASATDVGDLKPDELIIAYVDAKTADDWCYIERLSDGVKGWSLWSGVVFAPELLPPTEQTVTWSAADVAAFEQAFNDFMAKGKPSGGS